MFSFLHAFCLSHEIVVVDSEGHVQVGIEEND